MGPHGIRTIYLRKRPLWKVTLILFLPSTTTVTIVTITIITTITTTTLKKTCRRHYRITSPLPQTWSA